MIFTYIGLKIHTQTRGKIIVNIMHKLGISVSYDRIIEIENQLGSSVCKQYRKEGLVCPEMARNSLFTVGALDNIDHNPSSTTA